MDEEVHPDSDHIFHILEGLLEVRSGGQMVGTLKAGDTIRIPAGEYHQIANPGDSPGIFFALTTPPAK